MSNIINVNLRGGLGNQLFQIAYAIKIKKLFGGNIIINNDWFKYNSLRESESKKILNQKFEPNFKIPKIILLLHYLIYIIAKVIYKLNGLIFNKQFIPKWIIKICSFCGVYLGYNIEPVEFQKSIFRFYSLYGNFQWPNQLPSNKYLKSKFYFFELYKKNKKEQIFKSTNSFKVCVCLRLGKDYRKAKYLCIDYKKYLQSAFKFVLSKNAEAEFYIYCDDFEELKNINLPQKAHILKENDIFLKIIQMSNFKNFIIMNSSFAWWPLYFAELEKSSLVIMPKVWYKKGEYPNYPLHNLSTHLL